MQAKSLRLALLIIMFAAFETAVGQTKAPQKAAAADDAIKDNGDGTVTITDKTKNAELVWQKDDDGSQRNWDDSLKPCRSLSLGGRSDWRLPSLSELVSLWKNVGSKDDIKKSYFPSMKSSEVLYPGAVAPYWSSDAGGGNILQGVGQDSAGFVNFNDGSVHVGTKNFFAFYSRCVRMGK
jgi:hypothetical protein